MIHASSGMTEINQGNVVFKKKDHIVASFPGEKLSFKPKNTIYYSHEPINYIYYVDKGMIKLVSHLINGQERIIRLHNNGSWLGICGVFNEPCEHTAIAIDDVVLYRVRISDVRLLKQNSPHTYSQLLEHWMGSYHDIEKWITDFTTGPLKSRMARLLSYLHELEMHKREGEVKLLTCNELAEVLGVTTESVSRLLAEFKRNGILQPTEKEHCYRYNIDIINHFSSNASSKLTSFATKNVK